MNYKQECSLGISYHRNNNRQLRAAPFHKPVRVFLLDDRFTAGTSTTTPSSDGTVDVDSSGDSGVDAAAAVLLRVLRAEFELLSGAVAAVCLTGEDGAGVED